jgi:PAS domain S-box-containing protein
VGGVVLLAIAAVLAAARLGEDGALDRPWLLGVFAALVALENVLSIRLRKGEEGESRAHEEALLVCMMLILPPLAALAAFAAGVVAGQLAVRRGLLKGVFNVAQFVASAALVATVVAVLAPGDEVGLARVLASLVGVLVFSLVNRVAIAGVLAAAGAGAFWDDFLEDLGPASLVWAGAVSVGLLAGLAAVAHPWAIPFALAALVALTVALSGHARARHDRQALGELVDSSAAAIFSVDGRGRIRAWNPEMERVTGRPAEEAGGRYLADLVRVQDPDGSPVGDLLSARDLAGPRERRPVRLETASGAERWLTLSRAGLPDGGFTFVALDVTEQREAEDKLDEANARYRSLVEHLPLTTYIDAIDATSSNLYSSPQIEPLLGYSAEEWRSDPDLFPSIIHPDDRERVLAEHARTHETGEPLRTEYRAFARDGRLVWIQDEAVIVKDDSGNPLCLQGYLLDVTTRKAAEAERLELLEAEQAARAEAEQAQKRITDTLERMTDAFVALDHDWRFTYLNTEAGSILGGPRDELLGKNIWQEFPALVGSPVQEELERAATREARTDFVAPYPEFGRWLEVRAYPRSDGISIYFRDVTERRELEEQLRQAQKMEAIGSLAGGVAHDFNNMMSAVVGFSELVLARLEDDHPVRRQVEEIHRAGERASEMTGQLLAFSRKQILQPRVLDVNAALAQAEKLLRRLIGEDIDLVSVLDPELEAVEADPGQLEQVLLNLAVNARDAMPAGGKLTIETANVELSEGYAASHVEVAPGSYVLVAVSDTGIGMDAKTQARIFEPFFTTKEHGKGTGLGLATVFGIVKQSGGHLSVYSEPGRGTTFKIYLPRAQAPASASQPSVGEEAAPRGQETVLLVEDEELVRNLEREALEGQGYTVLEARDGSHALELAGNHDGPIDLLLTDVVMPGLSGRELAERLAPLRPRMKVLYASGYTDEAIVRHGVLVPGIAFLPKPVTPSSLACKVREVLDDTAARLKRS